MDEEIMPFAELRVILAAARGTPKSMPWMKK
jgi:hypothetical protein